MSDAGRRNTRYREAAEKIFRDTLKIADQVKVPTYGGVFETETGAFVEIQVWVPKEAIEQAPR
jgi:hypothetical protein